MTVVTQPNFFLHLDIYFYIFSFFRWPIYIALSQKLRFLATDFTHFNLVNVVRKAFQAIDASRIPMM